MSTGIGDALRQAREGQGRTIDEVAQALCVRTVHLHALEEERFDAFSGEVYAKGFLKSYAEEVGLDPTPLLDTYRREVGTEDAHPATQVTKVGSVRPRRAAPPTWLAWVGMAVVVLVGLALVGQLGGGAPDVASPESPPPVTVEEEDTDEVAEPEPEPEPEPESEPEPEPEGVELLLALEETSWMRVIVDGQLVFEQTVPAGETLQYRADQEIQLRLGNAGGVRVQHNGEDLGAQGGRGEVVEILFTVDGVEDV